MTHIVLVDDHAILLDGVKSLLEKEEDLKVVAALPNVDYALTFLKNHEVDMIITDFNMPGKDGISLVDTIRRSHPSVKIIMLSMHDEIHLVKEILRHGIHGYVLKKDTHRELIQAIHQVAGGKTYLSSDINQLLIQNIENPDEGKLLTTREREILKLITQEYSNREIGEKLSISERTVETHRKNIFKKTGSSSLVGLIKFAYANNLV